MEGEEKDGNGRLLALFDGVVAVTITLLMLEIRLPVEATDLADKELLSALGDLWPRYLGYAISFVVTASFWVSHRQKFQYIHRSNGLLIWLNILFLLLMGLVPFASSVISENPGKVATIFYAAVMLASSTALSAIWLYARHAGLVDADAPASLHRNQWIRSFGVALVFLLSIGIALIDADAAKDFWLLIIPVQIVSGRTGRARHAAAA